MDLRDITVRVTAAEYSMDFPYEGMDGLPQAQISVEDPFCAPLVAPYDLEMTHVTVAIGADCREPCPAASWDWFHATDTDYVDQGVRSIRYLLPMGTEMPAGTTHLASYAENVIGNDRHQGYPYVVGAAVVDLRPEVVVPDPVPAAPPEMVTASWHDQLMHDALEVTWEFNASMHLNDCVLGGWVIQARARDGYYGTVQTGTCVNLQPPDRHCRLAGLESMSWYQLRVVSLCTNSFLNSAGDSNMAQTGPDPAAPMLNIHTLLPTPFSIVVGWNYGPQNDCIFHHTEVLASIIHTDIPDVFYTMPVPVVGCHNLTTPSSGCVANYLWPNTTYRFQATVRCANERLADSETRYSTYMTTHMPPESWPLPDAEEVIATLNISSYHFGPTIEWCHDWSWSWCPEQNM